MLDVRTSTIDIAVNEASLSIKHKIHAVLLFTRVATMKKIPPENSKIKEQNVM